MFSDELEKISWEETTKAIYSKTDADVRRALGKKEHLDVNDFMALISPAATPYLEVMARLSQKYTMERFGKTISMFVPLYLTNSCTNSCVYCGFHISNPMKRTILTEEEIVNEYKAIKRLAPFENLLLVTGENPAAAGVPYIARALDLAKPYFSNLQIEVMPLKAEEYQELIKRDLKRLDGEKQAYQYRKAELQHILEDSRSMAIICTIAVIICILVLLILQYGFSMNTGIGYVAAAALGAAAITAVFLKYNNASEELSRVENGIGRIIRLQNTVKIRYVNNTHLLDYLYMKYQVSSARELQKDYQDYQQEREERERYYSAEKDLDECQKDLIHELRRFQIQDPMIWIHQTRGLLDKKEMVEIRHSLIIRRQSLRRRMDYNKEVVAGKAQDEIKDLAKKYPRYAREIMDTVDEYEKDFS